MWTGTYYSYRRVLCRVMLMFPYFPCFLSHILRFQSIIILLIVLGFFFLHTQPIRSHWNRLTPTVMGSVLLTSVPELHCGMHPYPRNLTGHVHSPEQTQRLRPVSNTINPQVRRTFSRHMISVYRSWRFICDFIVIVYPVDRTWWDKIGFTHLK